MSVLSSQDMDQQSGMNLPANRFCWNLCAGAEPGWVWNHVEVTKLFKVAWYLSAVMLLNVYSLWFFPKPACRFDQYWCQQRCYRQSLDKLHGWRNLLLFPFMCCLWVWMPLSSATWLFAVLLAFPLALFWAVCGSALVVSPVVCSVFTTLFMVIFSCSTSDIIFYASLKTKWANENQTDI